MVNEPHKPSAANLEREVEEFKRRKAAKETVESTPSEIAQPEPEPERRTIPCKECGAYFETEVVNLNGREFCGKVCPACIARINRETEAEATAASGEAAQRAWEALCPPLYRDTDLNRLSIPEKAIREVLGWSPGPNGLSLAGGTGKGKTRLIFVLLKQLHFAGHKIHAISSKSFERHCTRMFGDHPQANESRAIIDKCQTVEILFLDDIGKERMTDRVESELYGLIEDRTANMKPILWTSNGDSKRLEAMLSEDRGQPIIRRLKEFSRTILV